MYIWRLRKYTSNFQCTRLAPVARVATNRLSRNLQTSHLQAYTSTPTAPFMILAEHLLGPAITRPKAMAHKIQIITLFQISMSRHLIVKQVTAPYI